MRDRQQALQLLGIGDAERGFARDGGLENPRGQAARTLLYLFERDYGVQLLRGG